MYKSYNTITQEPECMRYYGEGAAHGWNRLGSRVAHKADTVLHCQVRLRTVVLQTHPVGRSGLSTWKYQFSYDH